MVTVTVTSHEITEKDVDVRVRECGQTLARVRVSRTYISIIIISLQRMEST